MFLFFKGCAYNDYWKNTCFNSFSLRQTRIYSTILLFLSFSLEKIWLTFQFHDTDQKIIKKPNEFKIKQEHYPSLSNQDNILNKVKGSLFGLAIGDTLGAHVEFRPHT